MQLSTAVRPISAVKAHLTEIIRTFSEEAAPPVVITQNGEAKAVLQDAASYYQMQETMALLKLLALAKEMSKAAARGTALGLTEDEQAFYDALGTSDSAVAVLGDAVLTQIARELTQQIRSSVTLDWTAKEAVRARLRVLVRRKLRQHGYPPDKTERAVETVMRQAEQLAANWAG